MCALFFCAREKCGCRETPAQSRFRKRERPAGREADGPSRAIPGPQAALSAACASKASTQPKPPIQLNERKACRSAR